MDRLSDMLDNDNSYICARRLTLLVYNAKQDEDYNFLHFIKEDVSVYDDSMKPLVYKNIQK